jgi:glycosyltransferase involved in cell wall biosynthesis
MHLVAVNWRDMRHPEAGGAEVHLHEILTRMVQRGHRATLFASKYPGASDFDAYDGLDVVRAGSWWDANFALPRAVRAFLTKEPADLIVEDINKIPFFMPWYTALPVMPVIPHLFGSTVFRETNPVFATYVWAYERLIPRAYRDCSFCVISPSTKVDLVERGVPAERVDVVLCGLDHGRYRVLPGVERFAQPTIVHFGRVRRYKAIDHVIRAYVKVRQRVPAARLIIVGDGPELGALRRLSSRIAPEVEFTGRVEAERLVELLNRAHLFVNASPKEGWGLTVIEANACGMPVVGTDRPGLRDSILHDKTGFLVEYGDVDAMARRAIELLVDGALWRRMSTEAVAWARSLTWERTADEMEQLFHREVG